MISIIEANIMANTVATRLCASSPGIRQSAIQKARPFMHKVPQYQTHEIELSPVESQSRLNMTTAQTEALRNNQQFKAVVTPAGSSDFRTRRELASHR